jgi:hypothetical protein
MDLTFVLHLTMLFSFFFHWDAVWTGTGTTFNIGGAMGAPNISNHHAKATRRNIPAPRPPS